MLFIASIIFTIGGVFSFGFGLWTFRTTLPIELKVKLMMGWCVIGLLMGILGALMNIDSQIVRLILK